MRRLLRWLRRMLEHRAGMHPPPRVQSPSDPLDPWEFDMTGVEPMDPDSAPTVPDGRNPASSHPPGRRKP
jgi:hypothetical protein